MILLNYGHPLTREQLTEIEQLAGQFCARVIEISVKIAENQPLEPQIDILVERAGLSTTEWQTAPLIINLSPYAPVAACLLAKIEGRIGHLPIILKFRRRNDCAAYEVSELINLSKMQNASRTQR